MRHLWTIWVPSLVISVVALIAGSSWNSYLIFFVAIFPLVCAFTITSYKAKAQAVLVKETLPKWSPDTIPGEVLVGRLPGTIHRFPPGRITRIGEAALAVDVRLEYYDCRISRDGTQLYIDGVDRNTPVEPGDMVLFTKRLGYQPSLRMQTINSLYDYNDDNDPSWTTYRPAVVSDYPE